MSIIDEGRRVLRIEAQAIEDLTESLDHNFEKAVQLILQCQGKVIVTGIGKSGQIGKKIASTFSSTGTPAVFLHPAEGSHGDLGVIAVNDLVIAISYGGESEELAPVISYSARKGIPMIAVTGGENSSLARAGQVCLTIKVKQEACPMGLAPTSSSTATLAMGDALAMAVLKERGFGEDDFAQYHPGGKLGRRLLTQVRDLMHSGDALPVVDEGDDIAKAVSLMTHRDVRGTAGVVNSVGDLVGVITDGDIRRRLEKNTSPFTEKARDLMSLNPKTINIDELAERALFVMEQFEILSLLVVDQASDTPKRPVGIIHLQDLLKARIR